ncbi:acyl-CoA thioesterase [Aquimarina hainanensis]|uniref:Acyl-CoA thioesterase n=1 Tax=Aquimarina hainanensis TaxID=1578017 RepID=A0ABW5NDE0_9FLAO|nr:acyl-CoA thioesterase [Aquimarina sp. TRL1]QKX07433.1 acyl-CoA thioesterase [Aquimarina sp. TRL1]
MKTLPKILNSFARIRFQDCDPFNHLNNASYLNYMINAREDQVAEHYQIDIFEMAKNQGVSWVVGSNQIAYLKPAFTMEKVCIESQLINFDKNMLQVEIRMLNEDKTELKAVLWSTFIHFNLLKQKKWNHNEQLLSLFESVKSPVEAKSFDERILEIKSKKMQLF